MLRRAITMVRRATLPIPPVEIVTLPVLPVEIVELALDYLRGDPQTLAVCCRVCRTWAPRARYNLFYDVELRMDSIAPFFEAVARDPSAATMTRELTLVGLWKMPETQPEYIWTTNLRTLRMHFMDTTNVWLPRIMLHARFSLTELQIQTCTAPNAPALVAFLQLLPHLRHFVASDLDFTDADGWEDVDDGEQEQTCSGKLPALQSLWLTGHRGAALKFLRALVSIPNGLENLCVLQIKLYTYQLPKLNALLVPIAEGLRELDLTVEPDSGEPSQEEMTCTPLSLAACRNLSALTLDVRLLTGPIMRGYHLAWLLRLFRSISSREVRSLTLVVRASGAQPHNILQLECHAIGRVLTRARFASLKRVVVKVYRGGDIKNVVGLWVREGLYAMHKRGILRIRLKEDTSKRGGWCVL